ncbi:MAG: copper resistance protein NlpE N-terminal domain-containing protein [Bacteroidaceae bacterium]|nr:copper resistance protein NlpE N-terminal domain-containing protein [Bacteroidaceae bacterium]
MKKVFMLATLVAALASCQSKQPNNVAEIDVIATDSAGIEDITEVYQGTLPAADGPGIDYILTLNEEINGKDTLFTLDMIYLDAKGAGKNMSFSTKGKQQKIHKVVNNHPKKAVKLTPNTGEAPIYFLVVNDTTLRMVNDSLMEVTTDTSYDIVRVDNEKN